MDSSKAVTWSRPARLMHWLTVVLVVIQIPLGFVMVEVYEAYTETYADDSSSTDGKIEEP